MARTERGRGRESYHHGDLATALVRATLEIVDEVGVRRFSVIEAARRTGVSPGAPYRHFADRDALLVAASLDVLNRMKELFLEVLGAATTPTERLAAVVAAYVRVAADLRGGYELLTAPSLLEANPELREGNRALADLLLPSALELAPDAESAHALLDAICSLMRGYAARLIDGEFGTSEQAVEEIAARATTATRALVAGHRGETAGLTGQ
ncbi:TetR/AcrR family transcriptional regulator [Streptomyces cuspidosporus]|uniref:TetR/AcrR family transcriptional regulator n=1 Tax=Streptomyces cuspidosporus TaxID=66882 RepID=A0ABN3FJX2_9ACTN